jgi:hypothetical protein
MSKGHVVEPWNKYQGIGPVLGLGTGNFDDTSWEESFAAIAIVGLTVCEKNLRRPRGMTERILTTMGFAF